MRKAWLKSATAIILISLATLVCWNRAAAQTGAPTGTPAPAAASGSPEINQVEVRGLQGDARSAKFTLAVIGEHLCGPGDNLQVSFSLRGTKIPLPGNKPECAGGKEVTAEGETPAPAEITAVTLVVNGHKTSSKGYSVSIRPNPPAPKLKSFQIKLDPQKNKEFPNLHSLLLTKAAGDPGVGFDSNRNRMSIELVPTGATDITVVQSNEQQLELHYVAAADYEPQNAIVTVYDSSDLDHRQPVAVAMPFQEKKPAEDPNTPKISTVETVFLERSQGRGRIRIFGQKFGDYPPPPYPADQYLLHCLLRPKITKDDDSANDIDAANSDASKHKREDCLGFLGEQNALLKESTDLPQEDKDKLKADPKADLWPLWSEEIRRQVVVAIGSRNPDLKIRKTEIIDISDRMIDVYFEFSRYFGYSQPLRLTGVQVLIQKSQQETKQTEKTGTLTATVTGPSTTVYTANQSMGPTENPNLKYSYHVLDHDSANVLLGRGIADNFYVLQVSVQNAGSKKVAISLAGIEAEVEWARGNQKEDGRDSNISYIDGPPTVSPSALAAVSAYFDAYNKNKGKRAIFFNVLDALTVVGAALVPYTGPSFKDAQVFWSGGFVPGVHKAMGDITGQQLQNLTSLSWQNIETVAPGGGPLKKYIYIQKKPLFAAEPIKVDGKTTETRRQITNLLDLEISAYEVNDSVATKATPDAKQDSGNADKAKSGSDGATGAAAITGGNNAAPGTSPSGTTSDQGKQKEEEKNGKKQKTGTKPKNPKQ